MIIQGNKPLDIATREQRIKNWAKDEADLLFWTCADDVDSNKRSDVAIYKVLKYCMKLFLLLHIFRMKMAFSVIVQLSMVMEDKHII